MSNWNPIHNAGLAIIGFAVIVASLFSIMGWWSLSTVQLWSFMVVIIISSIVIAGSGVVGRWQGLLIDDRNRYSLARLQMILWTTLVLSAFFTSVITNLNSGIKSTPINTTTIMDAATIAIPQELWVLMGIATTSLIGSPLILSTNKGKTGKEDAKRVDVTRTYTQLQEEGKAPEQDITTFVANRIDGQLLINKSASDANWSDMFKGDYVSNGAQLDLGKVQMMYFTMIVLLVYAAALIALFASINEIHQFPSLSEGMVALLGISNGGYLLNKAVSANKPN